ncbi:MAG: SBBP repeat-containing protein, partial [Methylobacter tundripaludum]|nr:SBBP repeat-containing protein [Methylobacter tundripaludum]
SSDFPTKNALQPGTGSIPNFQTDVFVAKLNRCGTGLIYSTYLGGSGSESGTDITIDKSGNAYITGNTFFSENFPVANAMQPIYGGFTDAFVTKLNSDGSAIIYSTYLGGSGDDAGASITIDSKRSVYVTGYTISTNFPTHQPLQSVLGDGIGADAFVTKLNPTGSALVYSTYLGGGNDDRGFSIAVDLKGNAYVTGITQSGNFPTRNPLQPVKGRGFPRFPDAFVSKLDTTGSAFVYSTYWGGGAVDQGSGIAVDIKGNAYVTGSTMGGDFPIVKPLQPTFGGVTGSGGIGDAFVTKFNPNGSAIYYSTFLGGFDDDISNDIAVDFWQRVYVTGQTRSPDFPLKNPLKAILNDIGSPIDGFVSRINSKGSRLDYSTYLGGLGNESASGVAVDILGNAYITGFTDSVDFPVRKALQPHVKGLSDAFITKISSGETGRAKPKHLCR